MANDLLLANIKFYQLTDYIHTQYIHYHAGTQVGRSIFIFLTGMLYLQTVDFHTDPAAST